MRKLGLDFGTTNSTLAFFDSSRKALECYRMRGASGSPYIPSHVRFDRQDGSVEIGRAARKSLGDEDYQVFSGFKMLLGEKIRERLEAFGYFETSPIECAKQYIRQLLANYREEQNIEAGIDGLVITVPEIWVKEHRHASRERLRKICAELDLPLKRFISEPVAASAYFAHCHKERTGQWFDGHTLLCDYGGGTLDLSLSRLRGEKITVLECAGKGHDPDTFGKAGIAFDEAVVKTVYERETGEKLSGRSQEFINLTDLFEEHKIDRKPDVDKALEQYLKNDKVNKKVFKINSMAFKASDLVESYRRVIEPELLKALEEMREFFIEHGVDSENRDRFRVVMAGGFSGFYLVRRTIMDFFNCGAAPDPRFNSCFTIEDTALAVAKGAALVANDMVDIDPTCPISAGFRVKADFEGAIEDIDIPVLKKGVKISEYKDPVFLSGGIEVNVDPRGNTPVTVFLGDGDRRRHIRLEKDIEDLFPGLNDENRIWKVGFSVDENFLFTLHTENAEGEKHAIHLGDLLEKVTGLILMKDDNEH